MSFENVEFLSPKQAPTLCEILDQVSCIIGLTAPINHIIVGLEPTFYISQGNIDFPGKILYLSLPLCRILTVDEFKAILGHELGHLQTQSNKISFFRRASVSYELKSDQSGIAAAGAHSMASALLKLHKFGLVWPSTQTAWNTLRRQQVHLKNASLLFDLLCRAILPEKFNLHQLFIGKSHFSKRLNAIGISHEELAKLSLVPPKFQFSSIQLIPEYEKIEIELTRRMALGNCRKI